MGFEEEFFEILKKRAEAFKKEYIKNYGKEDKMNTYERSYYKRNCKDTTKVAVSRFNDRINCGGYALEIDACLFPNGENFSNYISSILDNFDFIRLLGDEPLHDDEYLVFYRFIDYEENEGKNEGHHFVKVEDDGTVVEKFSAGKPMIFTEWHERYQNSPEVVFAVKKNHEHYFDSRKSLTEFKGGLDFEQTISKAIHEKQNEFSYHSHTYRLKKKQNEEVVAIDQKGEIVAEILTDGYETTVEILEDKEDYVENLTGPVKPIIENGKLINIDEFRERKTREEIDR